MCTQQTQTTPVESRDAGTAPEVAATIEIGVNTNELTERKDIGVMVNVPEIQEILATNPMEARAEEVETNAVEVPARIEVETNVVEVPARIERGRKTKREIGTNTEKSLSIVYSNIMYFEQLNL